MAEPRIHPSSTTAPEAPLMPPGTSVSSHNPPPLYKPTSRRRRRGCFCRCFCYTFSAILILLITTSAAIGILYLILKPKVPDYSINSIAVTGFNVSSSSNTLSSRFVVSITSYNPNKKIGIYYRNKGSRISVWMEERMLCGGTFPELYQGRRNRSLIHVPLAGERGDADGFLKRAKELQEVGAVPLVLRAEVPVRIEIGRMKVFRIKFKGRCRLEVNGVRDDGTVSVSGRGCRIRIRL